MSFRTLGHLLLGVALSSACSAGWANIGPIQPRSYPLRQQVQVWTQNRSVIWHSVHVDRAGVSGIPYLESPQCDSCRVEIPLGQVDSLRTGSKTGGLGKATAYVLGGLLLIGVITCSKGCSD